MVLATKRTNRILAVALAAALFCGAFLSGILFMVAWDDLAFRGRDALQAPDAIFAMRFYGLCVGVFGALGAVALWKGVRS